MSRVEYRLVPLRVAGPVLWRDGERNGLLMIILDQIRSNTGRTLSHGRICHAQP